MPHNYLKNKIIKYELYKFIILEILILCAVLAGRHFFFNNLLNFVTGLVLGVLAYISMVLLEKYIKKQSHYKKGLKSEEQVAEKLEKMNVEYESNIETDYGDLDFFVSRNNEYYGIEVKNWTGTVTFDNGQLKLGDYNKDNVLKMLLSHCLMVRNMEFGEDPKKFVKPMIVFGYNTNIQNLQNEITFNGQKIIVATIKNFEKYIQ